jgi:hypothetical protein
MVYLFGLFRVTWNERFLSKSFSLPPLLLFQRYRVQCLCILGEKKVENEISKPQFFDMIIIKPPFPRAG